MFSCYEIEDANASHDISHNHRNWHHSHHSHLICVWISQCYQRRSVGRRRSAPVQLESKASDILLCESLGASRYSIHLVSEVSSVSIIFHPLSRALGGHNMLIWAPRFSDFNLAVAILSFWVFITKCLLRVLSVVNKWTEFFLHCCLMPFWIVCLSGQQSTDYSDSKHPSHIPWYLTHIEQRI